eukprot:16042-Heterococcus_DN1.PRE.3
MAIRMLVDTFSAALCAVHTLEQWLRASNADTRSRNTIGRHVPEVQFECWLVDPAVTAHVCTASPVYCTSYDVSSDR